MNEETLILMVQKYEELYDMSNSNYSNQQRKDNCWQEISKAMKQSVEDCKSAWRRLRDSYRKAMKARKTKSGQAAIKKRPWKFENQMAFLDVHMVERETHSNIAELSGNPDLQHSSQDSSQPTIMLNVNNHEDVDDDVVDDDNDDDRSNLEDTTIEIPSATTSASSTEKRSFRNGNTDQTSSRQKSSSEVANALLQYLKDKPNRKATEENLDPLSKFFLSMAETVKTFPKTMRVEIKSKIFGMVTDFEMRLATNSDDTRMNGEGSHTMTQATTTLSRPKIISVENITDGRLNTLFEL